MTPMTLGDQLKRYAFATLATALAIAGSWGAVAPAPMPAPVDPPPVRVVHNPYTAPPGAPVRDPFMTGVEWREAMRRRLEPEAPPTVASRPPPEYTPPAPPPGSDLGLTGTMMGRKRYALLGDGQLAPEGSKVGRYTIEEVADNHIWVSYEGKRLKLVVPDAPVGVSPVTTTPVTNSPGN